MKKFLVLITAIMLFLAACSSEKEENKVEGKKDTEKVEDKAVEVDKGLFNVEITLPASFFEGQNIEEVIADAKKDGVSEVTKNEDGSLTYKMSKSKHKEMMEELETGLKESMDEMKNSEDFVSVKDVQSNKSYSEFTMVVDKEAYENSFDGFASIGLGMTGMYYQLFNGITADKTKVTIDVKDESTGEVFDTIVYPDDLEDTEE
ncbi:hypothetical protein [Psychrobacillus vulpis]|uniref:Antigen I/II N-terminal domain-containing protein n=1 Tax=Psychrobacillus vulpis TaxID=2325572 RepID=A0A544TS69_9BACI|nr:hypothetical protein [Psychrobacillus vulpis]TQR20296.1 hypothetical protein FG384_07585 [Psychrobacillus vulpis]